MKSAVAARRTGFARRFIRKSRNGIKDGTANERLRDYLFEAEIPRPFFKLFVVVAGDQNCLAAPTFAAEVVEHCQAIDIGHSVIDDKAVRRLRVRIGDERTSRGIALGMISSPIQHKLQRTANAGIIVRDEDSVPFVADVSG